MNCDEHVTSYLCMTRDIGVGGFLFGGTMMSWIDEAAGIYALRYTGVVRMVTLRYSELIFKQPVRVGEMVDFFGGNPRIGRTSFTFDFVGRIGNRVAIETNCTFVSIDADARPLPIPRPTPGERA
jgi:acyl-CoA thioesterase YciA